MIVSSTETRKPGFLQDAQPVAHFPTIKCSGPSRAGQSRNATARSLLPRVAPAGAGIPRCLPIDPGETQIRITRSCLLSSEDGGAPVRLGLLAHGRGHILITADIPRMDSAYKGT